MRFSGLYLCTIFEQKNVFKTHALLLDKCLSRRFIVELLLVGEHLDGKYVMMGYYDSSDQKLDWFDREKFAGGRGPPHDSTIVKESLLTVNIEVSGAALPTWS